MNTVEPYRYRLNGNGIEILKLLSAAVVNKKFRNLLLTNPKSALNSGYNGETFQLGEEERALVLSIKAKSLPEFAFFLMKKLRSQPKDAMPSKNGKQ